MGQDGCCDGHCCGDEKDECCEELTPEELAESNQIILSALIEVLQRKGVITQDELDAEIDDIANDDEEDDREEEDTDKS